MKTEIIMAERQGMEQALGESEQRYRRLLAATTDYIYTVKVENGRSGPTSHGPGCAAVTGYTSAEFAADPYLWYRVIHEEDRPAVLAQANRILAGETPPPLEHRLLHKQGEVRWVRNATIPHCDTHGCLVAYDGLISDITSRKRAELLLAADYAVTRELAESDNVEAAMAHVLEHLCQILLWEHAADWLCEGNQLRRQRGFWRAPFQAAADWEDAGTRRALALETGLPGRVHASRKAIWIPDVSQVPDLAREAPPAKAGLHCGCAFPILSNHEIFGVVELYGRDVQAADERMLETLGAMGVHLGEFIARVRSKNDLQAERNLLRTLIDNLPDCIFVKDTESRFLLNNAAHLRMLGAAASPEVLGKTDLDFFPKELASQYRALEQTVVRSAQPLLNQEERVVDRTGRQYWFLSTKVPLKDTEGKTTGLVGICRDITARKEAAERLQDLCAKLARRGDILKTMVRELKSSQKQLKETQMQLIQAAKLESVGTLAAGVAHEVINPLQTILLGLRFLAQKFSSPEEAVAQTLEDMRDAVNRANGIIRELLVLSAVSEFQRQPGSLNTVIERSLRLLQNELVAARVQVRRDLCPTLPKIPMDAAKLEQVFLNFILNAIQAMTNGGTLKVSTRGMRMNGDPAGQEPLLRRFKASDCLVIAEVEDSGGGIAEANLPRVFDPFFTTKPIGVGTGLGLTVARKIVDLHGGAIDIKNSPAGGARVTVVFKAEPLEKNDQNEIALHG